MNGYTGSKKYHYVIWRGSLTASLFAARESIYAPDIPLALTMADELTPFGDGETVIVQNVESKSLAIWKATTEPPRERRVSFAIQR
jgi:hypothetical protein